jgi:hypothetical protein
MIRDWRAVRLSLFLPGSKKFWNLKNDTHRLIFINIIVAADDEGRIEGTPEDVKMLSPRSKWSMRVVSAAIRDMEKVKLIVSYDDFIQVINFIEMQHWHGLTGRSSKIPPPPDTVLVSTSPVEVSTKTVPTGNGKTPIDTYHTYPDRGESEGGEKFDFKVLGKKWRHLAGRGPEATKTNRKNYSAACEQYGEVKVLAWAELWVKEQEPAFLKSSIAAWKFLKESVHEMAGADALGPRPERPRERYELPAEKP